MINSNCISKQRSRGHCVSDKHISCSLGVVGRLMNCLTLFYLCYYINTVVKAEKPHVCPHHRVEYWT